MHKYPRDSFQECDNVPGVYYCPGCNSSNEDFDMPSTHCPCSKYGTGTGSLKTEGVEEYLASV